MASAIINICNTSRGKANNISTMTGKVDNTAELASANYHPGSEITSILSQGAELHHV
jgi:hypothetical protein